MIRSLVFISVLWCLPVFAQSGAFRDTSQLPAVVIRSTPVGDTLRYVPASVAVLNRAMLSQNDGTIITSLLNQVPGVYMQQGALNTNRITIRGIGARSQYSTNRVKAFLDGIPITSAAGETVIEDLDLEVLESVEVVKGPASSMYGAGLGGAMHLYTRHRPEHTSSVASTIGSFGMMKNTVRVGHGGDKASFQLTYNHLQSDGFRQNANYDRKSLTLNSHFRLSDRTELRLLANLNRVKGFIPSSINLDDFENNPTRADANWLAAQGFESYDKALLGLSLQHRFNDGFSNQTVIFGQVRDGYEPRPFDILDELRRGVGTRSIFNLDHLLMGRTAKLAFGVEYLLEDYEGRTYENRFRDFPGRGSIQGEALSSNTQLRENLNVFAQQHLRLSEKWAVEAGLNLNTTRYTLTDLFANDSLDQSGKYRFGTIASPRVGATYKLRAAQVLYATVSHGFSVPGVEETLTPSGVVNTDLLPETGINYEIGFKADWLSRKLYTEAALYTVSIENLLVARRIAEDQFIGINAGKTSHTGAEIYLGYKHMAGAHWLLKPYVNASFHHFRFTDFVDGDDDFSGNPLTGVPTHTANAGVEVAHIKGFRFRGNMLHVGEVPLNDGNTSSAPDYALLNVQCTYETKFLKAFHITLQAGINNVTNANYAASVLPNAIGFGGNAPRYFYPGDARGYYAGLRLAFH